MEAGEDAADMEVVECPDGPPLRKASPSVAFADGLRTVPDEGDPVVLTTESIEDCRRAEGGGLRSVAFADDPRTAPDTGDPVVPATESGEDCRRGEGGGLQTSALCEWLRSALLEERAAVARDLLSKHTAMVAELESRVCAPAPGQMNQQRPSEDAFALPSKVRFEAAHTMAGMEQADCDPPGCVHLREAGEAGDAITRLESREVVPSPGSREGTVRKPRSTAGLSERRAKRSEPAYSESGSLHWSSTMRASTVRATSTARATMRATLQRMPLGLQRTANRLFNSSRESSIERDSLTGKLRLLVTSNKFEVFSAAVIVVTTICASLEVQYQGFQLGHDLGYRRYSTTSEETWPGADTAFEVMDYWCGVMFTIEVLLKGIALRTHFCQDGWNVLDLIVTVCWYMEVMGESVVPLDPTMLRMGRMVRLFRLLKLAKKINGFDSLYLMTTAIRGSFSSLAWSCCLLSLFQIVVALFVNSLLATFYFDEGYQDYPVQELQERRIVFEYWGSFSRALLTTFEITLADFPEPCRILSEYVNEWFAVFFVVHKLTIGFAVIGVINGVFIQETFKVATTDDQLMIRQREQQMKTHAYKMRRLFEAADGSGDGLLDAQEFQATMQEPDVQTWMASMDLDVEDAGVVFELVDADSDGRLTAEELVAGVSRLMGDARNLDLLVLMREQREVMRMIESDVIPQLDRILGSSAKRSTGGSQMGHTRLAGIGGRFLKAMMSRPETVSRNTATRSRPDTVFEGHEEQTADGDGHLE
jgi:hypothetical protein